MDKNLVRKVGKKLLILDKSIVFEENIAQFEVLTDKIIVMLEIADKNANLKNIYAVSFDGKIIWQVQSEEEFNPNLKDVLPYENLFFTKGNLSASDFYGRNFTINIDTGLIETMEITK